MTEREKLQAQVQIISRLLKLIQADPDRDPLRALTTIVGELEALGDQLIALDKQSTKEA